MIVTTFSRFGPDARLILPLTALPEELSCPLWKNLHDVKYTSGSGLLSNGSKAIPSLRPK